MTNDLNRRADDNRQAGRLTWDGVAPAAEQRAVAPITVDQLEHLNPSRTGLGVMERREGGTYVRVADVRRMDAERAAAGVPAHEQDLLDIVRSICSTAQRLAELSPAQRANYPSPLSPMSPLFQAASAACVERGYTRWGLAVEGVNYPTAQQPSTAGAPSIEGLTVGRIIEIANAEIVNDYDMNDAIDFARAIEREVIATQSAKQGAQALMSQRQSFEHWYSDEGKSPRAIERNGEGYKLMGAQSAWGAWIAAYKALNVTGRPSGSPSAPTAAQAAPEQAGDFLPKRDVADEIVLLSNAMRAHPQLKSVIGREALLMRCVRAALARPGAAPAAQVQAGVRDE